MEERKKKNFFVQFIKVFFGFIISFVLIVLVWFLVNFLIKAKPEDFINPEYTVHLRTDSVWDSVNPILDLQAVDLILSEPVLSSAKEPLINFRKSPLRQNRLVSFFLSRRLDFVLYDNGGFSAVLDTGILSGAVKVLPLFLKYKKIENLIIVNENGKRHFEYTAGGKNLYAFINRNLVILCSDKDLYDSAKEGSFSEEYPVNKRKTFEGSLSSAFSITADSRRILSMVGDENSYVKAVASCIPENEISSVDFGITNHNVNLKIDFPYNLESLDDNNPVASILKKESTIPKLVQTLPEPVQYYSVISAGSLEELKNAFFFAGDSKLSLETKWQTAESLSKTVFHDSLENLIFSWTSDEFAVLGLEQKSEPVFVLKISDETERRKVFDTIFSSIIIQSDSSLILNNVRLPRIELPSFFQTLLEAFGVKIPSPYYMIKDGFMYLSQSPENLALINSALKNGTRLSKDSTWKEVSENFSQDSSLSLFYNLERSVPFFLKSKSTVSKILQLYNVGRMDCRIRKNKLEISLGAVESKSNLSGSITGFPVNPGENILSGLLKSNIKNSKVVFYLQKDKIVSYNLTSQEKFEREIEDVRFLVPAVVTDRADKDSPCLWAVTSDGTVYLVNEKLTDSKGFPKMTGFVPSSGGTASKNGLIYNAKNCSLIMITPDGNITQTQIDAFDSISSVPVYVSGSFEKNPYSASILYERSFMGGLHVVHDSGDEEFFPLDGLGFGSPDVVKTNNGFIAGFISQSGKVTFTNLSGSLPSQVSYDLEGVFYQNLRKCENSFIALSGDGYVYRIDMDYLSGELYKTGNISPEVWENAVSKIKIPYFTARKGEVFVCDFDLDGYEELFVCGDGNLIFGFRSNLEMIGNFPVTGYGKPLFVDLDGDNKNDAVTLSLDNKINAWHISY